MTAVVSLTWLPQSFRIVVLDLSVHTQKHPPVFMEVLLPLHSVSTSRKRTTGCSAAPATRLLCLFSLHRMAALFVRVFIDSDVDYLCDQSMCHVAKNVKIVIKYIVTISQSSKCLFCVTNSPEREREKQQILISEKLEPAMYWRFSLINKLKDELILKLLIH